MSVIPQQFDYGPGLSCTPPSFFSQCLPLSFLDPFFASVPVCHFLTSYFLTISSYIHHHISCRLPRTRPLRFHLVCRLSFVPLHRCRLAPSNSRVLLSQHVSISCLVLPVPYCILIIGSFNQLIKAPLMELLSIVVYSDI